MSPKRIQMTRQRPWRADNPDAVIVARPSKWGNPWRIVYIGRADGVSTWAPAHPLAGGLTGPWGSRREAAAVAVDEFKRHVAPSLELDPLRGRDLACWCPLEDADGNRVPCHADVLLELANGGDLR